ncbi:MAG: FAD-dependent oxidoreductase [Clostridia bacterium]|nr:FAD-dependent oxidoreductase [Clostridia bacterium]
MDEFVCQQRKVPVTEHCDVAVIGGGPAGFAAAVSAARNGKSTVLAERLGALGGTASLGYVNPISGFFQNGNRVVGGLAWELVQRLEELGAARVEYPKGHVSFHPEAWKLTAQRMALESGVRLMTNMTLSGCMLDGWRVTHAVLDGKSGPEAVAARCFIDATGDADLCRMAGAEMMPANTLQPASLCFVLEGVDVTTPLLKDSIHHTGAGGSHSVNDTIHAYLEACAQRGELEQFGGPWFNTMVQGGAVTVNVTRRAGNAADRAELTRMECQLREEMFRIVALLKREYPEFRECSIVASGVNAGVRETRRILGLDTVTGQDMLAGRRWPCPVVRCAHPMDVHDARSSAQTVDYYASAAYVPHTALIPRNLDGLLATGRCISADAMAYASLRVQATVMAMGESAGLMAAEICDHGVIDPSRLSAAIRQRGVIPSGM